MTAEATVCVFRVWRRAWGSARWSPAPRLLVRLGEGGGPPPTQLSWTTEDGARSSVGFSPDMAGFYGHRRAAAGDVLEIRGELAGSREPTRATDGAHGFEFDTQVEEPGSWRSAGRLLLLVDDGGGAPVRWAAWSDDAGNATSVALHSMSPSGNADVGDLVSAVRASAEHPHAGEVARNLVAPSPRKWFAPHPRATLEFHLSQPIAVDRYILTSANDAPDRDPSAWTLRGSADGTTWHTLDVRSGQSFATRHQSRTYRIPEPNTRDDAARRDRYDRYRLDITGNNGSPHLQLETVRLLTDGGRHFVGHRQRAGSAPVPYRGTRVARTLPDAPVELTAGVVGGARRDAGASPRADGGRSVEWTGWQPGGSWLPLGGSLSMQSLTSPSGRFTLLHSVYEPWLAVRDNHTREHIWVSGSPRSSLVCLGPDGNLVAWGRRGDQVWSTGTAWRGVRRLELRDTGELALTRADGSVAWSTGIPEVPSAPEALRRAVPRGSRMRRGESLSGQSLTSEDGSTVLFHDGRTMRAIVKGRTSHWDRFPDEQNLLILDEDGFLRLRALDGTVREQIAGPGAELVVIRGAVELRDDAGATVWASAHRTTRPAPVREPGMPQNRDLAAWFGALAGEGRGYCVAVVRESTPQDVLQRTGLAPASVLRGTWRELQQHRDAVHLGNGHVVAAIAVGPDVLLVSDDHALPTEALAPSSSVAALHQPDGGEGYGGTFSVHKDGGLVTEVRDEPRRTKGAKVPEVAAALDELTHSLHRHELVFRTTGVIPRAAELGGPLLGGVLAPALSPAAPVEPEPLDPPLVVEGYEEMEQLVVRTDFTDETTWEWVVAQLRLPWPEDEPAEVEPFLISDPRYAGVPAERVLRAVRAAFSDAGLPGAVFIADGTTIREEGHPLLAVSTEWDGEPFEEDEEEYPTQFRVLPDAAVEVSVNLGLANMDFEDFAGGKVHKRWA